MAAAAELTTRPWLRSRWDRLNGPARIGGVDLARGLAVLGMFAAHLLWIDAFDWADAGSWIGVVNGRSSILFATLAGVSIGLVTGGRIPLRGEALTIARLRLVVRACLLWLLGIVLVATGVPVYVILPAYAILFLLTLPFVSLSARVLLTLAGILAVVMPLVQPLLEAPRFWSTPAGNDLDLLIGWHYPFPVWIAFVIAGLGVARAGVTRRRVQLWTLGAGAALAILAYGADAVSGADIEQEQASWAGAVWTARAHSSGILEVVGSGGFALAVIALCLLVCRSWSGSGLGPVGLVLLPIRAVGAMPLTAYTAQIMVWWAVAWTVLGDVGNLRGIRNLEPFWPLTLCTIVGCTVWALLVGRGPLEWLFDRIAKLTVRTPADPSGDPAPRG